jgi:PAT family beta-lactamase induction signal transducer AmpG
VARARARDAPVAPTSLRDAIWLPFLGFLARHRALEILAFVVLYKLADNLAGALLRPFLIDMGYSADDRGVALGTVGLGRDARGHVPRRRRDDAIGLGHALWVFGILQIGSNAGYILLADHPVDRPLMYAAIGFEQLTSGMGTGAFSVLLLGSRSAASRRRSSRSSRACSALPRILAGPVSGFLVDAIGWRAFFWFTIACGFPGLVLLARFVPPGTREPEFTIEPPASREPLGTARSSAAASRGAIGAADRRGSARGAARGSRATGFADALAAIIAPADLGGWLQLAGVVAFGAIAGPLHRRHGGGAPRRRPTEQLA